MKKILLIVTLLVFALSGKLSAQERIEEGPLVDRIKETIFSLNGYIADMVGECFNSDAVQCSRERIRSREAALTLFVGGGESYEVGGVRKDPVSMEVTSVSPSGVKRFNKYLMKAYFQRLISLASGPNPKYTKVTFISSDIYEIRVSSMHQVDDNTYEFTATFWQLSNDERDDCEGHKTYIEKTIRCIGKIEKIVTGQDNILILLGDTKCGESHRL